MDCNHARMLLILCRNRTDLDGVESGALDSHLSQCPDCRHWSDTEVSWERSISHAMQAVSVPKDLKPRILAGLDRAGPVGRRWPAWIAAAASILLIAGLAGYFLLGSRQIVDLNVVSEEVDYRTGGSANPDQIEELFREKFGVTTEVPRQFRYDLLYSFDIATFLGRRIPKLMFQHRSKGAIAEVYILSDRQFNFDQDTPQGHSGSSRTIQVLDSTSGYRYLVIFSGSSLEPFLNPDTI